jgi:sugar lactone lactonase YvrE
MLSHFFTFPTKKTCAPAAWFAVLFGSMCCLPVGSLRGEGAEAYKWSVQYLIDQSQSVFGFSQERWPRHNRALAISPDGKSLYAGYHQSLDWKGEVRKIDLRIPDYQRATSRRLYGPLAKAIAVDWEGRVYIADPSGILIYDSKLSRQQYVIPEVDCEGVAVGREGGSLVLYCSNRKEGTIHRWVLERGGGKIVDAKEAGLDGDGELVIWGAKSLRGVAIDAKGRIWVADLEGSKVYRVDRDGKNLVSADVKTPMAIGFDGAKVFVTNYTNREITLMDEDMNVTGTLSVPWQELELSVFGNNRDGALSGIAVVPGDLGFYVTNERGQTANQKSTYGRPDKFTNFVNGKLYIDAVSDDNDPILHAVPVTQAQ